MTIAISLKVHDGVVLASDSASSLIANTPAGHMNVINVYNSANKVFNLRKGLPIGAITWGAGSIGNASISTLAKDLRLRLSGGDLNFRDWHIDETAYTVLDVANRFKTYFFDELYQPAFATWPQKPTLGFIVAGYSSGQGAAEEYLISIVDGNCSGPTLLRTMDQAGATWNGEPEAINRLLLGIAGPLADALIATGVDPANMQATFNEIKGRCQAPLIQPAMPMQDAIDLAEFFVDLTIKWSRFNMGAPTVGGPIEVAAITKHEGFKWVKRKHYFHEELNPRGES